MSEEHLDDGRKSPFIIACKGKITNISKGFNDLTLYTLKELEGKDVIDVFNLLRIRDFESKLEVAGSEPVYLFTKNLEPRFVQIHCSSDTLEGYITYYFDEIPNSRIDNKFCFVEQLCKDNLYGFAIYSAPEFKLLKVNNQYMNFLESPFDKLEYSIGKYARDIFKVQPGSEEQIIFTDIVKRGKTVHFEEYEHKKYQRGTTYWNFTVAPILEDNIVKYIAIQAIDVTEQVVNRKLLEEQNRIIRKQKDKLEAIIECIDDILVLIDKDGKCIKRSKVLNKCFGSSDGGYKQVFEKIDFYDWEGNTLSADEMCTTRLLKGEKVVNHESKIVKDGKEIFVCANGIPIFDENGQFELGVMITHDLTEIVKSKKLVEQQKAELDAIIENMSDALFTIDTNYKFNLLNKGAQISVYEKNKVSSVDEAYSKVKYYDPEGNIIPFEEMPALRVLKGERIKHCKITAIYPGGISHYSLSGSPIYDVNGKVSKALICKRDVTEAVNYQQAIIKQKDDIMRMQAEFFSFISHEFRTPLTTISSTLQLLDLMYSKEMTPSIRRYVDTIKRSTFQQLRLVNNLLDITRAEAGYLNIRKSDYDIVSVTKAIVDSVKPFAAAKDIKIKFISSFVEKNISFDDEKYERILLNLISNAIKFTPPGKCIRVTLSEGNDKIFICVKDEGVGIPIDKQDIIFERFGQSNSRRSREGEGTGIGLYLVKLLVEAMGGEITVTSEEGKGSSFLISLPEDLTQATENEVLPELTNNRLVQSMNIEFSNIYDII